MEQLSTESRALRRSNVVFNRGVDPNNLVAVLYSNLLLTPQEKAQANQRTETDDVQLEVIFTTLERRVSVAPKEFHTLVKALRDEPAMTAVGDRIQAIYDEELAKENKNGTQASPGQRADSGKNGGGTKAPTMRELLQHVTVPEWSRFAYFLIDEEKVPIIEQDPAIQHINDKLKAVFRIFLEENDKDPTWEAVVDALEAIEKKRVADKIRKKFCQQ